MKCPCNPYIDYKLCCERIHKDIHLANTSEQLMRSRYSAFVLANINYLQKSHHSKTRPSNREKKEILAWSRSVTWVKIDVLNSSLGNSTDSTGTVEFKAFFIENGKMEVIHENSKFLRENNHWVYFKAN
ncbi:YchJ family metal-binding protein [uncultured Tenacibaculum sp.]|uniref:YchJ family protein n=1 Tax=uncultured Tenacibaculum sp. TaxID=174713 RepID=UPI0026327836|nr:YchJ family metal-binding protein [uncultured Tenacibaculum sp.]